jgi:hypothetical protein
MKKNKKFIHFKNKNKKVFFFDFLLHSALALPHTTLCEFDPIETSSSPQFSIPFLPKP